MNLKQFIDGIPEKYDDWEMEIERPALEELYEEILWELEEYDGEVAADFVVLHDKTIYQILVVIKSAISKKTAASDVSNDLKRLAEKLF